jgi:hypothetical protein
MSAPTIGGKFTLDNYQWARELMGLELGRDSHGAQPISMEALLTVGSMLVAPMASGGVQVELHRNGFDVEIEIGPDGKVQGASVEVGHQ